LPLRSGVEYPQPQGTLLAYEVPESLPEQWNRPCAYGDATNVPLEIEHIQAKSQGGTDRVSNLTLSCHRCNDSKGTRSMEAFVTQDPERRQRATHNARPYTGKNPAKLKVRAQWESQRWERLQRQLHTPLKDAAMVNILPILGLRQGL